MPPCSMLYSCLTTTLPTLHPGPSQAGSSSGHGVGAGRGGPGGLGLQGLPTGTLTGSEKPSALEVGGVPVPAVAGVDAHVPEHRGNPGRRVWGAGETPGQPDPSSDKEVAGLGERTHSDYKAVCQQAVWGCREMKPH